MGEPYIGEIRMFGFNFAPINWALCDGQQIPNSQNPALGALLGTAFGGDGSSYFNLPDFRGRAPVHTDFGFYDRGMRGGLETVTLLPQTIPAHTHTFYATTEDADKRTPQGKAFAVETGITSPTPMPVFGPANNLTQMNSGTVSNSGGGQAHDNMQPTIVINFCISLLGVFPTRN